MQKTKFYENRDTVEYLNRFFRGGHTSFDGITIEVKDAVEENNGYVISGVRNYSGYSRGFVIDITPSKISGLTKFVYKEEE